MKLKSLLLFAILAVLPTYAGTIVGTLQGPSGIPVKNATLGFNLMQAALLSGTGAVVPTTAYCYTDVSGNVVGLPNPLALPIVATQTSGAGTLPGGIYYVEETFYNVTGESTVSPELQIQLSSTGSLIVSLPTTVPSAASGVRVYVGTTRGGETLQGSFNSTFPGTFSQTVPLVTGATPPVVNSAPCGIAFNDQLIPYTGYNVSLVSSSGNAYPGWPQAWQLNGGTSGTVNVSQGAPLWNGVVIYPQPILSQPLNHGPQSIAGNLDFGGYNVTNVGTLTAGSVNSTVNAALQSGIDVGAKINASLALCGSQCEIYIPAGSYSYSTQIVLPLQIFGTYKLTGSPGAVLSYTGTSDAIVTPIGPNGPGDSNLIIEGFQINGNASATSGIHTYPTNRITIRNMTIQGFSSGDGIRVEGTNSSNIYDNLITNNFNGIHLIPTICNASYPYTCSSTGSGPNIFTPNAIHIFANQIVVNSNWCIWNDRNSNPGGLTGSLNNTYRDNDLEHCGTSPNGGSIYDTHSHGTVIDGNYFEASPHNVVLGEAGAGSALNTAGADVINNYFTTSPPISPATKQYNIELQNVINTSITGNSELITAGTGGNNCDINAITSGESGTYLGKNNFTQVSPFGSLLCINGTGVQALTGAGSYSILNSNYIQYLADSGFTTTSATSQVVPIQNMTPGGQCQLYPLNSSAFSSWTAGTSLVSAYSSGGITITHPGTANMQFNIICNNGPTN